VGPRDSALASMAWPACAGRLRTETSLTSFQVAEQGPPLGPCNIHGEALGSPSASLAKGRGALVGV